MFRDSDRALTPDEARDVAAAGIAVFQYDGALDTETALLTPATDAQVQALLAYAREEKGEEAIAAHLTNQDPELTPETTALPFNCWEMLGSSSGPALRAMIAAVASKKSWYKETHSGRAIAPIAWQIAEHAPTSPLARCVYALEAWLYA